MNLQELARYGYGVAKATIAKGDQVMPVFLAVMGNDDVGIIMAPWGNDDEKAATFAAMRRVFAEHSVKAYVFISECWMVKASKESPWDGTMPRDHPARVDILMVDGHTRDGERVSMMVEIDHLPDGSRAVTKEPDHTMESASQTGQAVNLLEPEVVESVH